jgi:hypothetical protein
MIERVEGHFDIKPDRLIGDTAYGTAPMLAWMVDEKDIEPHVPVWVKTVPSSTSAHMSRKPTPSSFDLSSAAVYGHQPFL